MHESREWGKGEKGQNKCKITKEEEKGSKTRGNQKWRDGKEALGERKEGKGKEELNETGWRERNQYVNQKKGKGDERRPEDSGEAFGCFSVLKGEVMYDKIIH